VADPATGRQSVRRTTTIVNRQGWHARPSAMVVKCSNSFKSDVVLTINGQVANGKSMMEVIMLASPCGSVVEIEAIGEDASACADALVQLIDSGFGEELA
jgi:phosphotransferase system HPr (HPr) family protein